MSPIVSPRRRSVERSEQTIPPVAHGGPHAPQTANPDNTRHRRPALQLVTGENHEVAPVLLAGADAARRAMLRAELSATLPPRTPFSEADELSEVLGCAASSRMVILAGDLEDVDAESLMRLLGRRHPLLPVINVDMIAPAAACAHG
jgi:hypothetical protein